MEPIISLALAFRAGGTGALDVPSKVARVFLVL